MIMTECIIKAEKISKIYTLPAEEIWAVRELDLQINTGEFVSIMGPSGSGKTTLLDLLGCLLSISRGKLTVLGKDVSHVRESALVHTRRGAIGFVFQDFLLIPSLTALENVLLPLYFAKIPQDRHKAVKILERVGLGHRINHLPAHLSGGEKQRVAIARAVITSPRLLIADEPTGNLDTKNSQEIFDVLKQLNKKERITILVTTHNSVLGSQAQRMISLRDGRIVTQ